MALAAAGASLAKALPAIGLVTSIGGTVMSSVAQKNQSKQQAKWLKYNAAVSAAKAKSEERSALIKSGQTRDEGRRLRSRQIALYSKAGISPGIGSPLQVIQDSAIAVETDAQLQSLAGREAAGFHMAQAGLERAQAKSVRAAGRTSFISNLATGIGGAAFQYATFKQNQLPGGRLAKAGRAKGLSARTASTITGRTKSGGFKFG